MTTSSGDLFRQTAHFLLKCCSIGTATNSCFVFVNSIQLYLKKKKKKKKKKNKYAYTNFHNNTVEFGNKYYLIVSVLSAQYPNRKDKILVCFEEKITFYKKNS